MNHWRLAQELFEETVALGVAERARVLAERAGGDEELVRSVEALVAADRRPLPDLDRTATDLLLELRDEPDAETLCGTTSGPYRIDEHVSSGGMAHVYRATRLRAETERRVALKVLRPGLVEADFLERFQRERKTLAGLEHEHVVSFLDAGALPDGRPFLVMEYVEGVPLLTWSRGVPLRRRIGLFLQVLGAVQYAHQKLVVHRDLKPTNVLVTPSGAPKLLDFGVASVLASEESARERAPGRGPLTPEYASPEQLRGEPVTTASDVYSLGILLHELVTGAPPGDRADGVGPGMEGDLGAISSKALSPDPRDRYRSADRMADDLRRFLASEPVVAHPATWPYRARLFTRRNLWPIALVAAVLTALVAGWIVSDLQRRHAEEEASLGWGAHGQAKVVARLFEEWITTVAVEDAERGAKAAAWMEEALRDRLGELPEAETLVRLALTRLYMERGELDRAAEHAERAWELARTTRGVGDVERRRAQDQLARVRVLLERSSPTDG